MKYLLILLGIIPYLIRAEEKSFIQFDNGQVRIGQSYLDLSLNNFSIKLSPIQNNLTAHFLPDTLRWVRTKDNIFTPQAEMQIRIANNTQANYFIKLGRHTITPSFNTKTQEYIFTISIQLFRNNIIKVYNSQKLISNITVEALPQRDVKSHYIDSSCLPYHLKIQGFENQYLSLYCVLERLGKLGDEHPKLKVFWLTPNFSINGQQQNNSFTTFSTSSQSHITLYDHHHHPRLLQIAVQLPTRLHRIKTAIGLGAYQFTTKEQGVTGCDDIVPDLTLYGKIEFNDKSSFRFFNAFNKKGALFNNFGLYFAYDLANILDNNVKVVALLGLQHVYYQYQSASPTQTQFIAPQGGEITWKHPFGIQNYLLGGGVLLSTKETVTYTNGWLRFGKKLMVEFNYIEWGYKKSYAQIFGVSLIYPFLSFF